MNHTDLSQPKPAYHHLKHPGGRLTKMGGQAVSLAPQLGHAIGAMGVSVSRIAIGAAVALAGSAGASYAACVETSPNIWTCDGVLNTTQNLTAAPANALTVLTAPGFGITTAAGLAFNLMTNVGDQALTFSDAYGSTITGAVRGINASHNGSGALSITTTGAVEGIDNSGIYASSSGAGTDMTISVADVTGRTDGILANNNGSGSLNFTSTGDVTGTLGHGVFAANTGTALTVSTAAVTGRYGIIARNLGSGGLSITATGDVTGTGVTGIYANSYGTDLTISATTVTGDTDGIYAASHGSGAISITATGDVEGTRGRGISARNAATAMSDITISAAGVTGYNYGVYAQNNGSAALSITTTGKVRATGTISAGIHAINEVDATAMTISTGAVSGQSYGINAINLGSGALSITTTGAVAGTDLVGIQAYNSVGDGLSISSAEVTGRVYGIAAIHYGTGALSVTSSGAVSATGGDGILAVNYGSNLTVSGTEVTGTSYGIRAYNYGSGLLSVTATGDVSGDADHGIRAHNSATGSNLTISAAAVSGGRVGILAGNYGSGALSITATGDVTATNREGIFGFNSYAGSDLTISATGVSGFNHGVLAANLGRGALSVTTTGDVTGNYADGIYSYNSGNGTNHLISAASASGYFDGIAAYNHGSGKLSITSTGTVSGAIEEGIDAINYGSGTDLTIYAADVSGGHRGINAHNYGSGALTIATTDHVSGGSSDGIHTYNYVTGTDVTVSAATVSGGSDGIDVHNYGSGEISITATGEVIGGGDEGVHAINTDVGTGITISTAAVTGYDIGIEARNSGTGALSITSTGLVTGQTGVGILGTNSTYSTDLTISAGAVSGNGIGIDARNNGTGALSITSTGDVNSTTGEGIYATNYTASADLTISTASVTGYNDGISAFSTGSGAFSITTTGKVTGTNRYGVFATNRYGTDMTVSSAAVTGGSVGIFARNYGNGALTVRATGDVTGISHDGLSAFNAGLGTDLTVYADTVTGNNNGIAAHNYGLGALSIIATGNVTGTTREGIYANNRSAGTDLSVSADLVTGYDIGLEARNSGTGALSITSTGLVTGQTGAGILGTNSSYGTDLTISASTVSGNGIGIDARNNGTGALSITSTGDVTSTTSDGIYATNYGTSTDLTISADNVTGYGDGITAFSSGSGAFLITTTSQVTGTDSFGIRARNTNSGTDMTINANDVTGGARGIDANHFGSGALSISATGHVSTPSRSALAAYGSSNGTDLTIAATTVSGGARGVDARNFGSGALSITTSGDVTARSRAISAYNRGTDLTIAAAGITADSNGILAFNYGSGALSITATGEVATTYGSGIYAFNSSAGTDLTISAAAVTGIGARNYGSGALSITTTGDVVSSVSHGIDAYNSSDGSDLTVNVSNVSGIESGILANNLGSGLTSVTANGTVSGGTGVGIDVNALAGSEANITLNSGADVSATSGVALRNNESDSNVVLNSGSNVTGQIQLADGSDYLHLAGGDVSGVMLFDGGDDSSAADGFVDTIQVSGQGNALAGASLTNWEVFSVGDGSVAFTDTALTIGDGASGSGVFIESGGILTTGSNFTLNAPLSTSPGGIFNASGGGNGTVTVNGDVSNDGILTSQDGVAGDVITMAGDYTGSGVIGLDTVLNGDVSDTDLFEVQGDTSGSSVLSVANAGGTGDVTSFGIEVISVAGNSGGEFTLAGDYETPEGEQAIIAGAYAYTLAEDDSGSWRLSSVTDDGETPRYQPGAPIYDSYALSLLALNGTSSLRHRGTSQDYGQRAAAIDAAPVQRLSTSSQRTPSPFWIQMGFDDISTANGASITGANSDSSVWELRAGADTILNEGETGFLVGGVIVNYANSDTKVASASGSGSIDTTGTGLTLAATWYDYRGFYVDGQLKYSRYDSDLTSSTVGALSRGNDGTGYALSVEVGQDHQVDSGLTLIPQIQLTQSSVDFDDFTGPSGERVTLGDAESLLLRLGLEVDQYKSLEKGEQRLYGIANIFHEFRDGSTVDLSGVSLANSGDDWAAEIGVGGNYSWDEAYSVYGEVSYATGLQNIGDSRKISANLGFKMEF